MNILNEETQIEIIQEELIQEESSQLNYLKISTNIPDNQINEIEYESLSNGQTGKFITDPGSVTMLQNRLYKIPVDCDENISSDDFFIKEFSALNKYITVRYIKDKTAGIISYKNGFILNNNQPLCILYK